MHFAAVHPPVDAITNLLIALRWIHFLAGITWVGLLYFFNLVNIPFQRELSAPLKQQVVPPLISRALWWFRWASVVTVLAGLWYWMMIVGADRRNAGEAHSSAVWSFFAFWTLAFVLYMGVLMSPAEALKKGPVLAVITIILTAAAAWAFVAVNDHGWESNRLISVGIGGGLGWFMMFNVWGLIWRFQKRLLQWTAAGQEPPEAARMRRLVYLTSRTNFWLSLPMLFFMAAASHYPMFGK